MDVHSTPSADLRQHDSFIAERAHALFEAHRQSIFCRVDRLFARLMAIQWFACIIAAWWNSPRTWKGAESQIHVHVWAAILLGGIITALPYALTLLRPGAVLTRHVVAAAQMLMSALLIHVTGGRVETHFHVFGSLAFLAFYRDWPALGTASAVVYLDHFVRGLYWPESVYGVSSASPWRALEHAGWVVFEVLFLLIATRQSLREMQEIARRQAELEFANERIEATVKERTAELRAINTQMEDFCYSISHDLRAPLRSMQGFSKILIEDYGPQLDSAGRDFASRIVESATRLDMLLRDLLEYSRISRMQMELEPVDLNNSAAEAVLLLDEQVKAKNAQITIEELPRVIGHPSTMVQVFLNIIGNALKYVAPDVRPRIRVWAENTDTAIRIFISDNGIGIRREYFGKIFGMFERLHASNQYPGTGIGLALVKKGVERMGGTVGLDSEPGKGSVFWFELPPVAATDPASEPLVTEEASK